MNNTKTRARVTVTIEISVPDTWGPECTIKQVHKQAKASAVQIISKFAEASRSKFRIIGEVIPEAIIVEEDTQ